MLSLFLSANLPAFFLFSTHFPDLTTEVTPNLFPFPFFAHLDLGSSPSCAAA